MTHGVTVSLFRAHVEDDSMHHEGAVCHFMRHRLMSSISKLPSVTFVTGNANKLREVQQLLGASYTVLSPEQVVGRKIDLVLQLRTSLSSIQVNICISQHCT